METAMNTIAGLIAALFFGYIIAFLQQKAKNNALLKDIRELTDEKEKIKTEYKLDLEKRKYRYELKKEQYTKYFSLLDAFNAASFERIITIINPIVSKFSKSLVEANGEKQLIASATNDYTDAVMQLITESAQKLSSFKNETHSIKLVASDTTLAIFEDLDRCYTGYSAIAGKLISTMHNCLLAGQEELLPAFQQELTERAHEIIEIKNNLMNSMREELNEI